jgi:DNA-binding transcriptional regulator YhcF (GntR family)
MVRSAPPPPQLHRESIAAALRELVNQLRYIGITEKNILEIADEMEGK